jgi:alkyldihydroxyacetonephosphate synthase
MTLCTLVFEGSKEEVTNQQNSVYRLAKKHNGFRAGAENGERGYFLTFMIGYLRDFALKYDFVAESFETSIPWKDVSKMCKAVEKRIIADCKRHGVKKEPFISFRVTQVNSALTSDLRHRSSSLCLLRLCLHRSARSRCHLQ